VTETFKYNKEIVIISSFVRGEALEDLEALCYDSVDGGLEYHSGARLYKSPLLLGVLLYALNVCTYLQPLTHTKTYMNPS